MSDVKDLVGLLSQSPTWRKALLLLPGWSPQVLSVVEICDWCQCLKRGFLAPHMRRSILSISPQLVHIYRGLMSLLTKSDRQTGQVASRLSKKPTIKNRRGYYTGQNGREMQTRNVAWRSQKLCHGGVISKNLYIFCFPGTYLELVTLDTAGLVLGHFATMNFRKLPLDSESGIYFHASKSKCNEAIDSCWFCIL